MNEQQLLKLKREIQDTEKDIQHEKGRLSSYYDDLKELLELPKESSEKKIQIRAKKKIQELNELIDSEQKRLDELIQEIEGEINEWGD